MEGAGKAPDHGGGFHCECLGFTNCRLRPIASNILSVLNPCFGVCVIQGTTTVADRLLAALCMLATRVKSQYGVQFKASLLTRLLSMAARACPVPFVSLPQVTLMLALVSMRASRSLSQIHQRAPARLEL